MPPHVRRFLRSPETRTSRCRRRSPGCSRSTSGAARARTTTDPHVTAVRRLPAVAAQYAPFPDALDPRLLRALARARHRAALHASGRGHRATPSAAATSSSSRRRRRARRSATTRRCSTRILDGPVHARAVSVSDQGARAGSARRAASDGASSSAREGGGEIGVFTYDGDTPQDARRAIRARAHVVLSNPDMVHSGILPHHPRWAKLFENLQFVVIDELHAYRGVFGSHLANIMRRLRRVCRHYGSDPTFICSSATIANPRELAERLTGEPFELVDQSGAPRGEKFFLFVNPPVVNAQLGIRRSYLAETRRVAIEFLKRGLQLIVFAQSRLSTEILTTYMKDAFQGPPGAADVIRGYRGGYLPLRRREIERGLRSGEVRCVVSTNALELGIDIGALDVAVMAGYPGTIAATWQRAGRAGRRSGRSAAVLVASSAPIDQFVVRHPEYFFDASPEHALVNPDNLHILLDHVKCAAFELPFAADERVRRRSTCRRSSRSSPRKASCTTSDGQWQWTQESYPADAVSLRSVTSDNFVVVDIDERRARDRRDRLHERPVDAAREGDLHRRGPAVSGGAVRLRQPQGVRARGRVRLLHRRDHVHEGHDSRHVRQCRRVAGSRTAAQTRPRWRRRPLASTRIRDARARPSDVRVRAARAGPARLGQRAADGVRPRRSPRRLARRRLQEDQVLHERERRLGRARSARAADAHDVLLADDSARDDGGAAVRHRRSARRRASAWRTRCATSRRCC